MKFIILTQEQADQVRGESLIPVELEGRFILGLNVLSDAAHAKHHAFLASLPQEEVELPEVEDA